MSWTRCRGETERTQTFGIFSWKGIVMIDPLDKSTEMNCIQCLAYLLLICPTSYPGGIFTPLVVDIEYIHLYNI